VIAIHHNAGGALTVTVNGRSGLVTAADAARLVVDGGAGDDQLVLHGAAGILAGTTIASTMASASATATSFFISSS